MLDRFFRAIRAFFGKLVGSIEDPAAILEQNIRDMNDQVPKMNEQLALVKANVTMLEREQTKLGKQEKELVSKIKAAISQNRDDIAANFAVTLEQVRGSQTRVATELKSAKAAFEKSLEFKKAFLREKEQKTQEAMRAIQRAKQAEWQSKVADAMEQFQVGGIDQTHNEMMQKIDEESAVNEAKMDMALTNVDVESLKIEEEAQKLRGMDIVNQMKLEMGMEGSGGSAVSDSQKQSEGSQAQKESN